MEDPLPDRRPADRHPRRRRLLPAARLHRRGKVPHSAREGGRAHLRGPEPGAGRGWGQLAQAAAAAGWLRGPALVHPRGHLLRHQRELRVAAALRADHHQRAGHLLPHPEPGPVVAAVRARLFRHPRHDVAVGPRAAARASRQPVRPRRRRRVPAARRMHIARRALRRRLPRRHHLHLRAAHPRLGEQHPRHGEQARRRLRRPQHNRPVRARARHKHLPHARQALLPQGNVDQLRNVPRRGRPGRRAGLMARVR